ncbi:biogenesis of lysosome-related organelles complex 1 subunit 3 [Lucilia sericata]|uniref:biogenesis of lysosome-related organelles complex 1 subunit 3 n=1 Tax=Lucilia sericata TaxID=13632 RepID=UPI0018A7ED70|nr:biogenesis of lysosome-related organelles complex 1 subunit 3 [Lucilia sericata]
MNEVVRGEASESEDETMDLNLSRKRILAAEVSGEASESDEDVYDKSLDGSSLESKSNVDSLYNNNLLQRKLIENNLSIWRSLNMFVKSIVTSSSKQLLNTDQLLIKSQTSMQSVLVTLSQTQMNMKQLYQKTDAVFTTNFIPNINVKTNKT